MTDHKTQTHAIVMGASMAGMFTARVLADYFDTVTIVERDQLPDTPEFRAGTPQDRHLHVLLARGQKIMEDLFPQLKQDLQDYGAIELHWGVNDRAVSEVGFMPRVDTGIHTNMLSRVGLEFLIRRRLREILNVHIRESVVVKHLLASPDRQKITGIQIETRKTHQTENLYADFVVDASGRSSNTPEWLQQLGYTQPEETLIDAFVGYSTCWFERPTNAPSDWVSFMVRPNPYSGYRGGIIYTMEGNRWTVILTSVNADYPPTTHEEFIEWSKTLATPHIYDMIKDAKPISPVYGYRRTNNLWRHYEKIRLPDNFIVTGDAAVSFNPAYGQGMSVSAMDAEMLGKLLKGRDVRQLAGFNTRFQKELVKIVSDAWLMATSLDLNHPLTLGKQPPQNAITRWIKNYNDKITMGIDYDPEIVKLFYETTNMVKRPSALFHPRIIWRIMQANYKPTAPKYHPPKEMPKALRTQKMQS